MQKVYPLGEPKGHAIYKQDGWHIVETRNTPSSKLACWSMLAFFASIVILIAYVYIS